MLSALNSALFLEPELVVTNKTYNILRAKRNF